MRFPVSSASLNAQQAKPAIVQAAKKTYEQYEKEISQLTMTIGTTWLQRRQKVKEYKDSETWRAKYGTWGNACRSGLGITPQSGNRLIRELEEDFSDDKDQAGTLGSDNKNKKEEAALKQVEKAREPQAEEPKEEEPEKPAVHSADEVKQPEPKAHTNGHVVKAENGRPKQSLAAWRELEESLIGRAINRADELNRLCPNTQMHARLVASLKASLTILEQWKQSVR